MNSGDAKRRGIYLALFTAPEGKSCFSIYQISWIKMKKVTFCKLKAPLSRNFVYNLQTFRTDFVKCIFTILVPENTDKPKFVAFLVFVCMTASFIAQISSFENVSKRDAILAPVANSELLAYSKLPEPIKTREDCCSLLW